MLTTQQLKDLWDSRPDLDINEGDHTGNVAQQVNMAVLGYSWATQLEHGYVLEDKDVHGWIADRLVERGLLAAPFELPGG